MKFWRKPLDAEKWKAVTPEIHIIQSRCKECGFCIEFCPMQVLEPSEVYNEKGYHPPKIKDETKCLLCGFCEVLCPEFAIYSKEKLNAEQKEEVKP